MANWLKGIIKEKIQWNERLFSLRIAAPLDQFIAGQFVRVGIELQGELVARPYSLVNAPREDLLEIYFNIVPEGPLTPKLAQLAVGDEVQVVDKASGFLTISEVPEVDYLWMVATGTGIGPFLSSLKTDEPWQRFKKVILVYSVRMVEELSYMETITSLQAQYAQQFQFVPIVTREFMNGALNERINTSIENGSLEALCEVNINADNSHIMMCGNSEMIKDVSELLEARGLRKHRRREPGHITTEKYH